MVLPMTAPTEPLDAMIAVLDLVRTGAASTRPEIARLSGLGRNVVTQRVVQLLESGLLTEGSLGPSTGGRAPRALRFRAEAGHILVAELGATSISVAISDLAGQVRSQTTEPSDVTDGPEAVLGRVAELFDEAMRRHPAEVWGVGIGLPGPVEFATGRPVAPPIMPGWDGFDVRGYFSARFNAPTWVDNDVNVMVLGELRDGLARGREDVIYVKVGSGIGAGLVSRGSLHRGSQGCAGDIGHIHVARDLAVVCRCGKTGCLEAVAGGGALAREGRAAALSGVSAYLAQLEPAAVTAADVGRAALHGDPWATQAITASARIVGETLAQLVNFFNPSLILIGGGVSDVGDLYLASVRQAILGRSLPLATRSLLIERSPLGDRAGLKGAAFMVIEELLSAQLLSRWLGNRSPAGLPLLSA